MKNTMRKAMLSTIAMLVVAVMSLTGVTYAWFSASTTAKVGGMTMNIGAAGAGLQVSKDNSAWASEVSYTDKVGNDMLPVSTVDGKTFFTADVDVNNTNNITKVVAADSSDVWTNTLYMRNTGNGVLTVQLNVAETAIFTTTSTADAAAVVDAARIAVLEVTEDEDGETVKTLKWVYGDIDNAFGIASIPASYPVAVNSASASVVALDNAKFVTDVTKCTLEIPANNVPVQYEIVVWLEGQDNDCTNKIALSNFSANFKFDVINDIVAAD